MPYHQPPRRGSRPSANALCDHVAGDAAQQDQAAAKSLLTKTVLLVRHGATAATRKSCFAGNTDSPLSRDGWRQAQALGEVIAAFGPGGCLCSPLRRCRQTAALILPAGLPATVEAVDLRELDFGAWEGKTFAGIARSDPDGLQRMLRFDPGFAPGGGELLGGFMARVKRAARQIAAHPAEKILVVTHGGVIRALLCLMLGLDVRKRFYAFEIAPAAVAEVVIFEGGAALRRLLPGPQGKEKLP